MSNVRWGIIGTGRMADWFCSDFGSVPNGEIAAVCSRTMASAQRFAERYKAQHTFDNVADLLASGTVDIVYIATPHTAHKSAVLQALDAGMPVLCEKPLVTSVADAKEVQAKAEETGVYCAEALWTWHLPAMKKAKQWVDEGRIGKLVHVKCDFGYPIPYSPDQREYDANDAGGALMEMGIYPVAISRLFLQQDADRIQATAQFAPNGVEMDLTALLEYPDATATLATSFRCRMRNAAFILGEDGYIVLPNAFRADTAALHQVDEEIDRFEAPRTERGYHYLAIATGEDVKAGRKQSEIVPLSRSVSCQEDMERILTTVGRIDA